MLDTGYLMLVEDPVFSGDKIKKYPLKIQTSASSVESYQETSIQHLIQKAREGYADTNKEVG